MEDEAWDGGRRKGGRGTVGEPEGDWAGAAAGAQKRGVSVSQSFPLPAPYPVWRLAGLLLCRSQPGTLRKDRLGANGQERSRSASGKGWIGGRDGVQGRTPVGTKSAAPPPRPYHCRRGPGQGLLGKWWAFGSRRGRPGRVLETCRGPWDLSLSACVGGRAWAQNQEKASIGT